MDKPNIIAQLNHLLSMEYAAYLAYQTTGSMLVGDHAPYWEDIFTKMSVEELGHAKELRERIVALGGTPTTRVAEVPVDIDAKKFLEKMLAMEHDAHKRYLKLYKEVPLEHLVLRETAEHIAKDEERDIEEIERLLTKTKK